MTHRDRESYATAQLYADLDRRANEDRCCDDRYDPAYATLSATQPKQHTTMLVHQLRNVITQAPNGAPVIIRTVSPGGVNHSPRELIHAEYGHVPEQHLTLVVAPELVAESAPPPSTPAPLPAALRAITTHKVNPANDVIDLEVMDEPGSGGAHHAYRISGIPAHEPIYINFQNGPIAEHGVNGITQEILLAIVIDRLECFQRGPFACKDNEDALAMIKGGLTCLQKRTRARMAQGVEGKTVQHVEAAPAVSAVAAEDPNAVTIAPHDTPGIEETARMLKAAEASAPDFSRPPGE